MPGWCPGFACLPPEPPEWSPCGPLRAVRVLHDLVILLGGARGTQAGSRCGKCHSETLQCTGEVLHHGRRSRRGGLGLVQNQAGRHCRLACANVLAGHFNLLHGECLVLNQLKGSGRGCRGSHCLVGVKFESAKDQSCSNSLGSRNPEQCLSQNGTCHCGQAFHTQFMFPHAFQH